MTVEVIEAIVNGIVTCIVVAGLVRVGVYYFTDGEV